GELWHALPTAERTIRCIQHAVGATSTAVTPSPATAVWGQSVVLTATVTDTTPPASTPAGSVQLKDGANSLGSPVALVAGAATTPTASLAVGTHTITAIYTPTDASLFITSTS